MRNNVYHTLTDTGIINRIKSGESTKDFEILYKRYYQKVFDKCNSLVKNRRLAEELAEDIFSKVFEKLSTFKQLSSFSSWLYSVTYNHCIDYLRERQKIHYPNWNLENEIPEIIDETEEPIAEIDYDKVLNILDLIHPEEKALLLILCIGLPG